jgi:hypothetical protein
MMIGPDGFGGSIHLLTIHKQEYCVRVKKAAGRPLHEGD